MRMIAGPNGSGKSTVKELLEPRWLGIYINPDEIETEIRITRAVNLSRFHVSTSQSEWEQFASESALFRKFSLVQEALRMRVSNDRLNIPNLSLSSYYAAGIAGFLRERLIDSKRPFTFKTVMYSADKIQLLLSAQQAGFKTYLYYVATGDPQINIARVKYRVEMGGHDVPNSKIVSRYHRSLALLQEAVHNTNRAFLFDNSGNAPELIAEIVNGEEVRIHAEALPAWVNMV